MGSGIGGVEWFENNCNAFTAAGGGYSSLRMVDPFLIPALIANTASGKFMFMFMFMFMS